MKLDTEKKGVWQNLGVGSLTMSQIWKRTSACTRYSRISAMNFSTLTPRMKSAEIFKEAWPSPSLASALCRPYRSGRG
jgi:hypothetical protein